MAEMPRPAVTRMVEDYVTLIWKAYEWPGGQPTTSDLAAQLGVTASTVSANLKKLARDGHISYEPYGRIELTEAGRAIAVEIVRRHRILETYLNQHLGLAWDQVHVEADQLEHALSDLVLDRMDAAIGHPTHDPHGDPIPGIDGRTVSEHSRPLAEAEPGTDVTVVRVSDRSPEILRYLGERGITIGVQLRVASVNTAAGSMIMNTPDGRIELSFGAAVAVRVAPHQQAGLVY